MPNTITHATYPILATEVVGKAIGATLEDSIALGILGALLGIISAYPDLYGVWKGSAPGWGFSYKKSDWAGYLSAHRGEVYNKTKWNPLIRFHVLLDKFSHEQVKPWVRVLNEVFNDLIVLGGLVAILAWLGAGIIIFGVALSLYIYKIAVWRFKKIGKV